MNENIELSFRPSMDYKISVASFDDKTKLKLKNDLINSERNHGLEKLFDEGIYSAESDDYIYLYNTLNMLRRNYNINYDINFLKNFFPEEELIKKDMYNQCNKHKIPYVHLKTDSIFSMGASSNITDWGKNEEIYIIKFDYEFIRKYLDFIIERFDPLFNNESKEEENRCYIINFNNSEITNIILNNFSNNIPYINLTINKRNLKIRKLKGQGKNNKFLIGKVPPIYNTKGFEEFCTDTDNLIATLFDYAVNSIMAHELAHIGNGHIKMKLNNMDFCNGNEYIQRMLEFDADTTALRWVLGSEFMNGEKGPFDKKLNIVLSDLVESLKLKVVSYYMVLRWTSIKDSFVWDENIVEKYNSSESVKNHPPFQLRVFQMLINAFERLDEILEFSNRDGIITKDNKRLTKEIVNNIKDNILEMIASFESVYGITTEAIEVKDMLVKFEKIMIRAKEDINKTFKLWPEISEKLEKYSYCKKNFYNI